jgi:uncharacterized protein (DUF885 family)
MKTTIVATALAIGLAMAWQAAASENQDAALAVFFKDYLEKHFRQSPLSATRLGDHRFDHLLDDLSATSRAEWRELSRQTLEDLPKRIDYAKLSRSGQIDYEIFKRSVDADLWLTDNIHPFNDDPRIYNDYATESVYLLLTQSTLPKAQNVKNSAARIRLIPKALAAARQNLGHPPRVFLDTAIRQNRGAIAFYEHAIYDIAGENPQLSELAAPCQALAKELRAYQKFLEDELARRADGQWRIGKEKFARKLDYELDAGLSAEQVLQDAESEFVRVENEMYVIARQLWAQTFPGKALPPDDADGRRSTILQVLGKLNQNHNKVENLVSDARDIVAQIKKFIAEKDILRLPEPDHCQVLEMPEFQRGNTVAFLNPAAPLDPRAASIYAISPPPKDWDARRVNSYLEEYNRYMMHLLTIHEGYPGHYVQLDYANRHPSFIRRVLSSGVFAEGWAVYTEQMMLDQGYGDGNLALRLNQLKWYLRTVANALLDHRMHCTQMSDREALEFLTKGAYQSEGEALGKIVRAKQSSCQLSTYFVGRMAFYRLRQQIEREQGDQFDLGRYHEAVLAHGTLPVKYLPELVHERLKQAR